MGDQPANGEDKHIFAVSQPDCRHLPCWAAPPDRPRMMVQQRGCMGQILKQQDREGFFTVLGVC